MISPSPTLEYSTLPDRARRTHYWLNIAMICGGLPLLAGTVIITLFLTTYNGALELIGLLNIAVGGVLFIVGAISLFTYVKRSPQMENRSAWQKKRGPWVAAILLLTNFPVCVLYVRWALENPITLVNQTGVAIESVTLTDPDGAETTGGGIAPGSSRRIWVYANGEGDIHYVALTAQGSVNGDCGLYITGGMTGRPAMVIITGPPVPTTKP